jgi:hypothetical protein
MQDLLQLTKQHLKASEDDLPGNNDKIISIGKHRKGNVVYLAEPMSEAVRLIAWRIRLMVRLKIIGLK